MIKIPSSCFTEISEGKGQRMARPVQNAAVCRVNSKVDVLPFEPPAAELLQRNRSNRSQWTSQVNIQWPNLY